MTQLDKKFTQAIQDWLSARSSERDIQEGATMLLQLNRNRAFFNSVLARPEKYMEKLEYELRKHLNIRLKNMAVSDVVALEQSVMPRVERTLSEMPGKSELPSVSSDNDFAEAKIAKGKRSDHDSLPADIQKLYDDNAERFYKVNKLFNELKAMADAQPCDRYEKLVILDKTEADYRRALLAYDSYDAKTGKTVVADPERVSALRKNISTYKSALSKIEDASARLGVLAKLQAAVSELLTLNVGITETTKSELIALGIALE